MRHIFKVFTGMFVASFGLTDIDYFADMYAGLLQIIMSVLAVNVCILQEMT